MTLEGASVGRAHRSTTAGSHWSVWHVRTIASAAALGLLLVGCGSDGSDDAEGDDQKTVDAATEDSEVADDSDGEEDDHSDEEPVPASSDGPAQNWPEPEKPDAMFEETEEGAIAALEYWFEARTYARNTGDVGLMKARSSEECLVCEDQIAHIDEASSRGTWYNQDDDALRGVESQPVSDELVVVEFVLDSGGFDVFDEDGLAESVDGSQGEVWEADLKFSDKWQVRELEHMRNGDSE